MHAYQKGPVIGEGTYGSVICATQKATGRQVAIKKVRLSSNGKDGVNMSVLRELKALRSLAAPSIVELLDTFSTKSSLVLVFEFMEWSLEDVIRDKNLTLSEADVKSYMQMLVQALAHVHGHQALHRDIKPDNLLISSDGQMKLADFGLARFLSPPQESPDSGEGKLTPQVFGRWYRPPELLMGSSTYSYGVDMWAAGCVFAELLLRKPWFPGNCDMDQLDRMFKVLGVPTLDVWPGYADLPHRIDFKPAPGQPLEQVFKQAPAEALDLLRRLMVYDPEQRISAAEALAHPYFTSQPAPTPAAQLPRPAATRLNRLGLSRVPAVIPDMLMPHRLLQQQQQGFSTAGVAAAGWADAGEAGEALLMQQQQQQRQQEDVEAAAVGRSGLAGRAIKPGVGSSASRLLAFSDAPSFSGRFLGQGLLPVDQPQQQEELQQLEGHLQGQYAQQGRQQQQQHLAEHRPSVRFATTIADGDGESEQEAPWKGRLSFGCLVDDSTAPGMGSHAAAEGPLPGDAAGDENALPSGMTSITACQQQQHWCRRPSPISSGLQQQQQQHKGAAASNQPISSSSLRPPLHPNATPVHLRTGQHASGAAAGNTEQQQHHRNPEPAAVGDECDGAAALKQRRGGVSNISAALSNAASGTLGAAGLLNPLAPMSGMPRAHQQQQQQQPGLLDAVAHQGPAGAGSTHMPSSTPASAATRQGHAGQGAEVAEAGLVAGEADTSCPMSLGTSARKRSRTVFEAPGVGQAAAGAEEQQQGGDGDDALMLSSGRRVVRGRRSSVGSGCCSMEMDPADGQTDPVENLAHVQQQQQQQEAAAGVAAPVRALCAGDRSHSITSEYVHGAIAAAQTHQQQQQHQQHDRELQDLADMPPPHAVQPRAAGLAAASAVEAAGATETGVHHPRPWSGSSAGCAPAVDANCHCSNSDNKVGHAAAAVPGSGSSTCPMSLDHRGPPTNAQHQPQQHTSDNSGQPQQHPASSAAQLPSSGGINSGDLVTGGRPTADELRSMDPAELAELAKFWRPRLGSAERRYLRCRTMQLGEALLQASQPDDVSEGQEYHRFPGIDSSPSSGGLFDTPATARRHMEAQAEALHTLENQNQCGQGQSQPQEQQQQQAPSSFRSSAGQSMAAQPSGVGVSLICDRVGVEASFGGAGPATGLDAQQHTNDLDSQGPAIAPGATTLAAV